MSNYFKNTYEPTLEEMQQVFPDYNYGTKESWLEHFQNMYPSDPIKQVKFALYKLHYVTTSYKMDELQKTHLQKLILGEEVDGKTGWEAYCSILTPKQISYVGY